MSKGRILHIDTERSWRGGEQQAFSLVKGLQKRGWENFAVARSNDEFLRRIKKISIPICEVNPFNAWDPFTVLKIRKFINKNKIDLIHAHTGHAVTFSALATLGTSVPFVLTRRVDFHLSKNFLTRWKYSKASHVIAISENVKNVLLLDGVIEKNISIVRSGIEFERFNDVIPVSKEELGVPNNAIVIGNIAALEDHKDHQTLIKAFALFSKKNPDFYLVIVGDGSLKNHLLALGDQLQINDKIRFLGFRKDALRYLAAFDFFCLSSKLEGLGTSVLDAMGLKIPVIATNAGGIPEMIEEGKNGFLAMAQDPHSLFLAFERARSKQNELDNLVQSAYQRAMDFSVNHTISGTEAIYLKILPKNNRM
ncbi:MAG: glycosyltransferase [Elusimicrobiota bacterium]